MRRPLLRLASVVAILATVAVASGCSLLSPTETSTPTGETVASGLSTYYDQTLTWHSCEKTGMQCATAKTPLDWADPTGPAISLALIRHKATGTRLGSLLVNPGGPGGSGYDFVADSLDSGADQKLQASYDIVGFDPRGVGRSTPVSCGSGATLDHFFFDITAGTPGSDAWFARQDAANTAFAKSCEKNTGALLAHVETASVARDLDMLRAALGDTTLTYLGYSYGTLIGSIYAEMFPSKAGRLVLDGVVDPAETTSESTETQSKGFESALRAYLSACIGEADCPFTGTVDEAVATIGSLLDTLDASPLRNSDGRELGGSSMVTAIILPLYSKTNWPYLDQLFSSVMKGSASIAFTLADSYYSRTSSGTYSSNTLEVFAAVTCLDYPAETDAQLKADAARLATTSPLFGPRFIYSPGLPCAQWPYPATRAPAAIHAIGSGPILVVGTTNDPATPYVSAQNVAKELQNGHLVTFHGEGHTAYGQGNACVDGAVDSFLISGTVPASDPDCH